MIINKFLLVLVLLLQIFNLNSRPKLELPLSFFWSSVKPLERALIMCKLTKEQILSNVKTTNLHFSCNIGIRDQILKVYVSSKGFSLAHSRSLKIYLDNMLKSYNVTYEELVSASKKSKEAEKNNAQSGIA